MYIDKTSQYRGVSLNKRYKNPWIAQIQIDNRNIHLGRFSTEKEAAKAYDKKATELYGELASLNFSEGE